MRSIRFPYLFIEALILAVTVVFVTLLFHLLQSHIKTELIKTQTSDISKIDISIEDYVKNALQNFDNYLVLSKEKDALFLLQDFSDIYYVSRTYSIDKIVKKEEVSQIFTGYDLSGSQVGNFLRSIRDGKTNLSRVFRSAETENLSFYVAKAGKTGFIVGRIGLNRVNDNLSQLADYTSSIILIATRDGFVVSSTKNNLHLNVLPPSGQHEMRLLDDDYILTRRPSRIFENDLVILTPLAPVYRIIQSLEYYSLIFILVIIGTMILKIAWLNYLFFKPLLDFSALLSKWEVEKVFGGVPQKFLAYKETASLYRSFADKTDKIQELFSELRQTMATLQETQRKLTDIIDFYPDATLIIDNEGKVIAWNRAIDAMTGVRAEEMLGKGNYEYALPFYGERRPILIDLALHPDPEMEKHYTTIQREEDTLFGEAFTPNLPGGVAYLSATASALRDSSGEIVAAIECIRDNTERKKAESAIKESERQMNAIVDGSPIPQFVIDRNHRIIHWNRALEEYSGIMTEDVVNTNQHWRAFYNNERPCMADLIVDGTSDLISNWYGDKYSRSRLIENAFEAIDYFPAMKGGIWLYFTAAPIYNDDGIIIGAVETLVDITERKRAEDALEESRRELETLLSNLPGMAYRCLNDREWTMEFVSEGCLALTGYTPDDLMSNQRISYNEIIHLEDRESVWNQVQEALEKRARFHINYRIVTVNGEVRWVWEQGSGVYSPAGEMLSLEGFITDITDRKHAEEVLRLNAERSETLLKINQLTDATHQDIMSFGFEEAMQLTKSKIGYLGLINEDESVMTVQVWSHSVMPECNVAAKTLSFPLENAGLWAEVVRQRRTIITNNYNTPNPLKKGYPEGHIGISRHMSVPVFAGQKIVLIAGVGNKEEDYTEDDVQQLTLLLEGMWRLVERKQDEEDRRKLESQIIQFQKMEAIGTLAGGIAHDFNNILAGIIGYTELYKEAVRDRPKVYQSMEQVLKAGERAKDLVKQILTFSRKAEHEKKPVLLSPIVREVVKFLRASLPTTIEIKQTIDDASDAIMADPTQMHQVLMNLCTNAGHAMKDTGGILEIVLKEVLLDSDNIINLPALKPGRYLELSVCDSGNGITKENMGKIFDPYFTTKQKGEGTGLGLAVVHGIVKNHGGEIKVYSEEGRGTIFRVYLPLLERQIENVKDIEQSSLPGKGETILFVDDEQMVVNLNKQMLEGLGYKVFAETNPVQAIETFKKNCDVFDLLITDKTMPHMTGFDVVREIRNIRADIPVLLCSGFQEREDMEKITAMGINQFIIKPFRMSMLAKTIRDILDKGKSP